MEQVKFEVSVEEANVILEALGQLPFARVYSLVGKLQEQAARQLNGQDVAASGASVPPPAPPEKSHAE